MKKPEFPKPRIIREDFLPNEPMKKYRIKKVTEDGQTVYYPQKRILWWWVDMFYDNVNCFCDLENAKKAFHRNKVEYIYDLE